MARQLALPLVQQLAPSKERRLERTLEQQPDPPEVQQLVRS